MRAEKAHDTYLVFDIETIHDREAMKSDFAKRGVTTYEEYIKKMLELNPKSNTYFAKHIFHQVVCISFVFIQLSTQLVKTVAVSGLDEKKNLIYFWLMYNKRLNVEGYPTFVTFNGKNFDMPVINMRSLKYVESLEESVLNCVRDYHNTEDKWEKNRPNYLNNYSKYHIDLYKDMDPSYGNYFSLANICAVNDISVKTTAHGDGIEEMVQKGDWETIDKYCCEDSLATAELLMKYLYFTKDLSFDTYDLIKAKLIEEKINLGI